MRLAVFWVVLFAALVAVAAFIACGGAQLVLGGVLQALGGARAVFGGGPPRILKRPAGGPPRDLVVDTLNLVHWRRAGGDARPVTTSEIVDAVDATSGVVRRQYRGRVVYVLKDRETAASPAAVDAAREAYHAAAERNGVEVHVVEKGRGDRAGGASHAALGRDDFYLAVLAKRYRCPVLSRDRFRDLDEMKAGGLDRFAVRIFVPGRAAVGRDYVNPAAPELASLRRPATVDFDDVIGGGKSSTPPLPCRTPAQKPAA